MGEKKEPLEITCSSCEAHYRIWIPKAVLASWESGSYINCIKCGTRYSVTKTMDGVDVVAAPGTAVRAPRQDASFEPAPTAEAVPAASAEAETAPEPLGDTVLLIEDDKLTREMAQVAMKEMGINLIAAKNGSEAIEFLGGSQKVTGIVTDLYLKNSDDPDSQMDGEDLLREIADKGFDLPAIIITGKDIIDDIVLDPKWFDLHVKGFIQKGNPFWVDELKLKLKEMVSTV